MDAALIDYARRSGFNLVIDDLTINGYRNGQVWVRRHQLRDSSGSWEISRSVNALDILKFESDLASRKW